MDFLPVRVSVPAKVMLVGEYAVMEGYPSLSLALDKKLEVVVSLSSKDKSIIHSSLWDEPFTFRQTHELESFNNILTQTIYRALQLSNNNTHFELKIGADFCVSSGFGSSSALRFAVLLALSSFFNQEHRSAEQLWEIAHEAYLLQKEFQGRASGYDILTQKVGGVVSFKNPNQKWPGEWSRLSWNERLLKENLHIFIGGKGAPTKDSLRKTSSWLGDSSFKQSFYNCSLNLYQDLSSFFCNGSSLDFEQVLLGFSKHRSHMQGSPGFPLELQSSLSTLSGFDRTWSFKTTGSGGEDALLFRKREKSRRSF